MEKFNCEHSVKQNPLAEYSDLLSIQDLSKIFGVSKKTIYKELHENKFGTPIKVGRTFKVSKYLIISEFISS